MLQKNNYQFLIFNFQFKKVNINELKEKAYQIACSHGWYEDKDMSVLHCLTLVMSEIGEVVNADRSDKYAERQKFENALLNSEVSEDLWKVSFESFIKGSVEDEMADVVIRMLSLAAHLKMTLPEELFEDKFIAQQIVALMEIEEDAKKRLSLTEELFVMFESVVNFTKEGQPLYYPFLHVFIMARRRNIDLHWHIEQKMKYNELRPYKHGKKY